VVKHEHVEWKAVQYIFETEEELAVFCGAFGKTTTFGKRCRCPIVGESRYLQHLDILNVVVPLSVEDVKNGKWQVIVSNLMERI